MSPPTADQAVRAGRFVFVVSTADHCDAEAARVLLSVAQPELSRLGGRMTRAEAKDVLLWSVLAWNHALDDDVTKSEMLATLRDQVPGAVEIVERVMRRRVAELASRPPGFTIGPLRLEAVGRTVLSLHVDRQA